MAVDYYTSNCIAGGFDFVLLREDRGWDLSISCSLCEDTSLYTRNIPTYIATFTFTANSAQLCEFFTRTRRWAIPPVILKLLMCINKFISFVHDGIYFVKYLTNYEAQFCASPLHISPFRKCQLCISVRTPFIVFWVGFRPDIKLKANRRSSK